MGEATRTDVGRLDGIFSPRARRLGVLWVAVTLPTLPLWGFAVDGPDSYILVFVVIASGTYTTPALVATWLAARRAPPADRLGWRLWFVGVALTYLTGVSMLVGLVTPWRAPSAVALLLVVVIGVLITAGTGCFVRIRSGRRAVTVDAIEAVMVMVAVAGPVLLLCGERVVQADQAWFAVPAAFAAAAMVPGFHWAVVLAVRLGFPVGTLAGCGIVLGATGAINGAAQTAHAVSGFDLPGVPLLLLLHGTCMAMLLLVPLHIPRRVHTGLHRLPPQAQVRGGGLSALVVLAGLPVLLAVVAIRHDRPWVVPSALGVVVALLILATLRHLATGRETRRLYAEVAWASTQRRELLALLMQRVDDDRHRVAAQLHEQAVSAYASFVSFLQLTGPDGLSGASAGASTAVRDDLARHADSLRHLVLAVRPLENARGGSQTLAAPIRAYLDSLYDDGAAPRLAVTVADGLVLGWVAETIALRIVQEALRNVWAHSGADLVQVTIGHDGDVPTVRVVDDGRGFDPTATLFESGFSAMRSFAAVCEGTVRVDSRPGEGTTVVAHLGGSPSGTEPAPRPSLRLVRGSAEGGAPVSAARLSSAPVSR